MAKDQDFDWKIAICLGLGMTQAAAAEYLGCTRQTIINHLKDREFFQPSVAAVKAIREIAGANQLAPANLAAEERIKSFFDRSFRLSEQLLTKAEALGEEATVEQLMDVHKNLTVWAAKFTASEAPKRMKFEGSIEHEHRMVPASVFEALAVVMREQKLLPEAIEAEVIENTH